MENFVNSEKILKQVFKNLVAANLGRSKTQIHLEIGFVSLGNHTVKN